MIDAQVKDAPTDSLRPDEVGDLNAPEGIQDCTDNNRGLCPCTGLITSGTDVCGILQGYASPDHQCLTDKLAVMDDVTGTHHSLCRCLSQAECEPVFICEETGVVS